MTVKEMKELLDNLPDDAGFYFIGSAEGNHCYDSEVTTVFYDTRDNTVSVTDEDGDVDGNVRIEYDENTRIHTVYAMTADDIAERLRQDRIKNRIWTERINGCVVNTMFMDLLARYGAMSNEVNTFQEMMNKHFDGAQDIP